MLWFVLSLLFSPVVFAGNFTSQNACQNSCPTGSCCEVGLGQFECCAYSNGVCCGGAGTCCPQGSQCMSDGRMCEYPNGFETALPLHAPTQDILKPTVPPNTNQVVCPNKEFACPDDSTCCPMGNGSWGCCSGPQAECCSDGMHCCPQGTKCNVARSTCDIIVADPTVPLSFPQLGSARQHTSSRMLQSHMSYTGVKCDSNYECPDQATCCRNTTGGYACCPMPGAVCCSDGLHCCPMGTTCDLEAQRCVSTPGSLSLTPYRDEAITSRHQLCPDDHSVCLDEQTCCKRSDDSWGCCPLNNAICCSDGKHCCPAGFKCDLIRQTCVKLDVLETPTPKAEITCPYEEFRCAANTTCCPLPNEEFACCPFEKAVCCSDMAHCCPENTTCDIAGNRCVKKSDSVSTMELAPVGSHDLCPSGLVSCPGGTCCKNVFGIDACCPHLEASCCRHGYCCPKGTRCDDSTRSCSPVDSTQPSTDKPSQLVSVRNESDIICPDKKSVCPIGQTCCQLKDGSYGCCPMQDAVCCSDGEHCCPPGYTCAAGGLCVRSVETKLSRPPVNAQRMVPMSSYPIRGAHLPENSVALGGVVRASFCGGCAHDWLCCPDADGLPNRMCCPSPGSVCCADGLHCCPSGTLCSTNGQCIPNDRVEDTSFAIPLSRPSLWTSRREPISYGTFTDLQDLPASHATRARINLLFLVESYRRQNEHQCTVCPDHERFCGLHEKCCPSRRHGYVCIPSESSCCFPEHDMWCPVGYYCSGERTCKRQPGRFA